MYLCHDADLTDPLAAKHSVLCHAVTNIDECIHAQLPLKTIYDLCCRQGLAGYLPLKKRSMLQRHTLQL